jgi:hypothetical protein
MGKGFVSFCVVHFVKSGCGDFASTNPPLSLFCLPSVEASVCPADYDRNRVVNTDDLQLAKSSWGPCNTSACPADGNFDGKVDLLDVVFGLDAAGPCPSSACVPLPSNITSYWPGNTGSEDRLGANVGVLLGNATITPDARFGAGAFNRSFVWVPLDSPGTRDWTIELWFKMYRLPERDESFELFKWGSARLTANFNSLLRFSTGSSGKSVTSEGSFQAFGSNTWYAVAVSRVGTTLSLYVDGYRLNAVSLLASDTIGLPNSVLTFGAEDVVVDDVALFASFGRSTLQIFGDYANKRQIENSYC